MRNTFLALILTLFCGLFSAQALYGREVVDMSGRKVQVPDTIRRIFTPYRVATGLLLILGEEEKLVGMSTRPSPMALRIFPRLGSVGIANRHSSIEEILKMRPDLVITSAGPQVKDLEYAGIPVFCISAEDPDSLINGLAAMGDLLGKQKRAQKIGSYYRSRIDYITRQTSRVHQKKKVYLAGARLLSAVGGDFYQDRIIHLAGGINVSRQGRGGWVSVSREHLLSWNPDVILTLSYYGKTLPADILKDKGLRTLNAVSEKQVHTFPSYIDSWDLPSPESILGIMWLAGVLYPEEIGFDMEKEASEFYTRFYGSYPQPVSAVKRNAR